MNIDFERIEHIKNLIRRRDELSAEIGALCSPRLTDTSLMPAIYSALVEITHLTGRRMTDTVMLRYKFLFIVLYLYSPYTLAGGRIPTGLRSEIGRVLGLRSDSVISDNCRNIVFMYRTYESFRRDIGYLYREIIARLDLQVG